MSNYLLDTNICIEILRGNKDVSDMLSKVGPSRCRISEITVIELKLGEELAKLKSKPGQYVDQHLNAFFNRIEIIPITPAINIFVKEKARLQLAGTPAHNNFDLLIGCTAVANKLIMVTDNIKDFKNIKGIKIENWIEHK